jgi:phosphoribosyl 1,2-cyclic phosphodiesterase
VAANKPPFWLRFWGTRGSLPAPRPTTNKYGGNTPCVEVRVENRIFIFDAGSGIRPLGASLQKEFGKFKATILFSHYHWDHIHGFPFFPGAYNPANQLVIYGEPRDSKDVRNILSGQMALPYFPVPLEIMQAKMDFKDVGPKKTIRSGPVTIKTESLNHPGRCLSYRINYKGKSIVYATDTEHGDNLDMRLVKHAKDADILIYDAAYTDAEMKAGKKGFGHSTWREGVKVAKAANVKKLLLFHHEPARDDRALEAIEKRAKKQFRSCSAARELKLYYP